MPGLGRWLDVKYGGRDFPIRCNALRLLAPYGLPVYIVPFTRNTQGRPGVRERFPDAKKQESHGGIRPSVVQCQIPVRLSCGGAR